MQRLLTGKVGCKEVVARTEPTTMVEGLVRTGVQRPAPPWLPPYAEYNAYEGIRRGEGAAFRAVAQPLQPVLRRLVRVIVPGSADADSIIVHAWAGALRSLDMFRWHTPFASWVAGLAAAHARVHAGDDPAAPDLGTPRVRTPPVPAELVLPGPSNWSDLPWGARWEQAPPTLAAAFWALPLAHREVVHARDVEQWPLRRVCDVLGLLQVSYERLLGEGRAYLHDSLAPLVGEGRSVLYPAAQIGAVCRMLRRPVEGDGDDEPLDPGVVAIFRRWRATRLTGWQRLCIHLPVRSRVRAGRSIWH